MQTDNFQEIFKEAIANYHTSEIVRLESLPISPMPDKIDEEIDFNLTLHYLKLAEAMR